MSRSETSLEPWGRLFPAWDVPARVAAPLADCLGPRPRDEAELAFVRAVDQLPKAELHVHMEAAVPASFYVGLNARRRLYADGDLPAQRAPFPDFPSFIKAWLDNTKLVDAEARLAELARAFVAQRAAQRIVYSEAHISPFDFTLGRHRFPGGAPLDFRAALSAYLAGLKAGLAAHPGIEARLIVDIIWISDERECETMLAALEATVGSAAARCAVTGEPLIVGVGMGGPEEVRFAPQKKLVLERCRAMGLKIDIHSGETTSEAEHRYAVDTLAPDRVGHGIAPAVRPEKPGAKPWFYARGVTACPSSNLLTGSFRGRLAEHPIAAMRASGVPVCINTDDPLLFGTTLALEFAMLRRAFRWELAEVAAMTRDAAAMALAPAAAARAFAAALGGGASR